MKTGTMDHPLCDGNPPPWASEWGQDEYGLWLGLTYKDVTQRLRWVGPGRFTMGSPGTESGRFPEREGPRHEVVLNQGFWLFDTPCTQALWEAVMGENPSRFKTPERPVEQVSWDDVMTFTKRINEAEEGLELTLPTEAQWEYACRAGTATATYAGDIEILGTCNAPVLDAIAWYAGNSGEDYELEDGVDSSGWPEKQYEHTKAGTHPVGKKQPNAWGLYDMLGNVWEWCLDGKREYSEEEVIDPVGLTGKRADRVIRGGGWNDYARYVRAASRDWRDPSNRWSNQGFRCAQVQKPVRERG